MNTDKVFAKLSQIPENKACFECGISIFNEISHKNSKELLKPLGHQ